ncbi:MAG: DEAD/DEAH box helicase, partial [Vicinamibacteria bacterium]
MPFAALGLAPEITRALHEQGYTEPTPIQARAIPLVLSGRDVVGIAQTGTGKTAAFVLPLLQRLAAEPPRRAMRALIVAPTRELVAQIDENLQAYARHLQLSSVTIYGGVGERPQINALRRGVETELAEAEAAARRPGPSPAELEAAGGRVQSLEASLAAAHEALAVAREVRAQAPAAVDAGADPDAVYGEVDRMLALFDASARAVTEM